MEELWHKVCNHFAVPEDVDKSWYTRIYQRLNESHSKRYYHNWNEMMQHKREHLLHCKPALVLAAFFQYYSYDGIQPCAKENCAAFEEFCCDASLDDQESKNSILKLLGDKSVENELQTTFEDDANFLQDLDLVILAANSENYKRYCQLLRKEYEHMSDMDYKNMRLKVLQTLLSIPNIFSTTEFQTRYEATARANMKDEISTLKTQADETPTTSAKRKSGSFNKFRDNTKRRLQLRNKRLNRSTTSRDVTSASQRVTKKLLRTIRRRQLQNQNKSKLQRSLRTKLNMANKCAAPTSNLHNLSLEEGEIVSDDEVNNVNLTANTSTDDDCICIEPQIEQIIIDDDLPNTTRSKAKNNNSSGYVSIIQRINGRGTQDARKLLTSTPCGSAAARNSSQNSVEDFTDLTTMFYEDVSRINTLDSIRSEDTFSNYTHASKVVGNPKSNSRNRRSNKKKNHTVTSKDVIVLDDTVNDSMLKPASNAVNSKNQDVEMDDSVIFISETTRKSNSSSSALDFVPLSSKDVPNPIVVPVSPPRTPRKAAVNSGLFTTSEKKALVAYNNNTYNPNAGDPKAPEQQSKKRLILIDGCNVAFNHALNREFSVKGLTICIDYFEKMGHEVKAVVPQFRMHKCSDSAAMFELHGMGKIVVTPCKNLPGKFTISYDDRFVLQLAAEMDAAIVSNDNYRDLINENAAFKKLIENRVIGFTWCNDLFMVAKDPYGKWGPSLQTILNRT